jgi:hypothetical protein
MASPQQPDKSSVTGDSTDKPVPETLPATDERDPDEWEPRTFYLRLDAWDVVCTCALITVLVVVTTTTSWPARLFGFAADACTDGTCGLVPFGADQYIYPVMWGGIGAAVTAAALGPIVSLVRGWHMYFWPIISAGILMLSSLAGYALTTFSERYWH